MLNTQIFRYTSFGVCLIVLTGCSTSYNLHMRAAVPPRDTSSVSPRLKGKKYTKIMIMPPSGTARGEFDTKISIFEKEFIKNGITPINGAVTGRVVMELQGDKKEKKDETAQNLSDVERALIMAKETGADALLQIGQFEWSPEPYDTRYFIADPQNPKHEFEEVALDRYTSWNGLLKRSFKCPWFTFIGRLTDVQSGEVMASFKVEGASNWSLPGDYFAVINNNNVMLSENFPYDTTVWDPAGYLVSRIGPWNGQSKERIVEAVIAEVAKDILAQDVGSTESVPSPSRPTPTSTPAAIPSTAPAADTTHPSVK